MIRNGEDNMSTLKTPFRYDFVGSFLRPQALTEAKAACQEGKISKEELDKAVKAFELAGKDMGIL